MISLLRRLWAAWTRPSRPLEWVVGRRGESGLVEWLALRGNGGRPEPGWTYYRDEATLLERKYADGWACACGGWSEHRRAGLPS